jgi:hypothetical protein
MPSAPNAPNTLSITDYLLRNVCECDYTQKKNIQKALSSLFILNSMGVKKGLSRSFQFSFLFFFLFVCLLYIYIYLCMFLCIVVCFSTSVFVYLLVLIVRSSKTNLLFKL